MEINRFALLLIYCLFAVEAKICPLMEHQVCNDHTKQLRCVCAMSMAEEAPPEQVNLII